ncbi:MAG: hypothetical protein CVU74_02565 [Deltaproteobacteria bacterium HGW-Deltaproteobacteria-9]|nr:MAG: hypothetical protein CVU74_02565 [Deltaproteobacteria bacterium HGW-Deltaproteobacteria-9]
MNSFARVVLLILWLGFTGCTYFQGYVDMAKDKGLSDEYQTALNTWTRTQTVHSQFETKVSITSTLKSQAFSRAYLKEYERIYQLAPEDKKKREQTLAGLTSDFTEFLFYAYTPEKEANDFDKQNSVWTVFIVDNQGKRLEPVEIRRIDKITAVMESFFPYINKYYGSFYSLKFKPLPGLDAEPGDSQGKSFKLVMTSVLARVELEW